MHKALSSSCHEGAEAQPSTWTGNGYSGYFCRPTVEKTKVKRFFSRVLHVGVGERAVSSSWLNLLLVALTKNWDRVLAGAVHREQSAMGC